jgi:hypothetical protein
LNAAVKRIGASFTKWEATRVGYGGLG